MRIQSYLTGVAVLATSVTAQTSEPVATYTDSGHGISVNVPSDTASSGSGPIYFQISAPSGTQWVAFGQGNRMAGANMFVVYSRDSTNVTISGRAGTGHSMPQHDDSIQLTLLEGSGISGDGSMVANVRCDNCNEWSGGSMDFTSSSASWIYASKSGDALDTDDVSASISQHNSDTSFNLDLTSGTGGSSVNPFVAAAVAPAESASPSGSASASADATASATGGASSTLANPSATNAVSNPLASSGSDSTNSGSDANNASSQTSAGDDTQTLLSAHGIIMSVLFLGLFPLAALTVYLPTPLKVRYIHAPLQAVGAILLIVGLALGVVLGQRLDELDGYHQIIGYIVVASLILFQPAMGVYQHLHYHKTGGRTIFGSLHRWLGRSMIILGIINGGLGWQLNRSQGAYIPYAVVAAIVFLIYLGVLFFAWHRAGRSSHVADEKAQVNGGYEMRNPNRASRHHRLGSDEIEGARNASQTGQGNAYQQQQRYNQKPTGYTVSSHH